VTAPLPSHPYAGRTIALASRHGKERAIARPFRAGLACTLRLAERFDTDLLGTFSGEVPRPSGPEHTCRLKAEAGMAETGLPLGLASEGSFGPHPFVPLLPAGQEWMTFVDRDNGLVIREHLLARRTNFSHRRLGPEGAGAALEPWLRAIGFPGHALIVRPSHGDPAQRPVVERGIRDRALLTAALRRAAAASGDGLALVETDMRAHLNPTRMASIRTLAFRLVRRIGRLCPACGAPGWGVVDTIAGLPCGWCGSPTELVRLERHGCVVCSHREDRPRRDGRQQADPGQCPLCNP
jgi:hypothetical protein